MRHLLAVLIGLMTPTVLFAQPDRAARATELAQEALARGDAGKAVSVLQSALRLEGDEGARVELYCLLGAAHLAHDDAAAADAVLAEVPADATCGRRAAFLRAEALLALDRAEEAVQIYGHVGGPRLGPDRDADSAEAIARIARQKLADIDERSAGLDLLARVLSLHLDPGRRRGLTRELIDAMGQDDAPWGLPQASTACQAMQDALVDEDLPEDRLRAAGVCEPDEAWWLLASLPETPERLRRIADRSDPITADVLRSRALEDTSEEQTGDALLEVALGRAAAGRVDAVEALTAAGGADPLRQAAELLARAGRFDEAIARLDEHAARYPTHEDRDAVLDLRAHWTLERGRRAAAAGDHREAWALFDDLLARTPDHPQAPRAALEAGISARAAGDPGAARDRWNLVLARWPHEPEAREALGYLARLAILDDGDPTAALALLRSLAARVPEAATVADDLRDTDLWIRGPGRVATDPVVRVGTRNLASVELRLHRIDVEAYVRSGSSPQSLRALDVGVVAPDRTWTVAVPQHAPSADRAFDVPIKVPGPGLYEVTVASDEEQARALVLVSDLVLVAKAVGDALAVATFTAGGEPVAGAAVIAVTRDHALEGRTDPRGLWLTEHVPDGPTVLFATYRGAPAFLELPTDAAASPPDALTVQTELEPRPALPGDTVGMRLVARRGGQPVVGPWTFWLAQGPVALSAVHGASDRRGVVDIEIPVPPGAAVAHYQVMALPPDAAQALRVGDVTALPQTSDARSLDVRMDELDAVIRVSEPDGRPAAGVVVTWGDAGRDQTDAAGLVRVPGPGPGIPWALTAQVAGTEVSRTAQRTFEPAVPLAFDLDLDRIRPGEAPRVRLRGAGVARVQLMRVIEALPDPTPLADPWLGPLPEPGPLGAVVWAGGVPAPDHVLELVHTFQVEATDAGAPIDLEGIEPGRWALWAAPLDGHGHHASIELEVDADALRLKGVHDAALGERLSLEVEGGAALVTVASDRLLWAGVLTDGTPASALVASEWGHSAVVSAVAPDGRVHERTVAIDPDLHVDITTTPLTDGAVRVDARVTDGTGRPVSAQVALSGWDERLADAWPIPDPFEAGPLHRPAIQITEITGIMADFRDADPGSPISGALQDEALRVADRERARRARSGQLADNDFTRTEVSRLPSGEAFGLGGLGTKGYGSGLGGLGGRAVGRGIYGFPSSREAKGVRDRVLWQVAETDGDGLVSATLRGPPGHWKIRASALTADAVGAKEIELQTLDRLWLVAHEPGPGLPDDRSRPTVTVVNGTDAPFEGVLSAGEARIDVALAPGAAVTRTLGAAVGPGPDILPIRAASDTATAATTWAFPLARGLPDADGPIATVTVGPGGAFPYEAWALQGDPALLEEPWRQAARGRSALAALRQMDRPDLHRAVRDALDVLRLEVHRGAVPPPAQAAAALMFLAEVRDVGLLPVPKADIDAVSALLSRTATVEAGAWAALARARAGLPVDPDLLAFLRDAELTEAQAGVFARALAALGLRDEAIRRAPDGIQGALARLEAGEIVDHEPWRVAGPPAPGDPVRADWLRLADPERTSTGAVRAVVEVDGQAAAELDLSTGGTVRLLAGSTLRVDVPGALITRSASPAPTQGGSAVPLRGLRLPALPDGRAVAADLAGRRPFVEHGCSPCTMRIGDAVRLPDDVARDPTWQPSGLTGDVDPRGRSVLRATAPGTFVLRGLHTTEGEPVVDLRIDVVEDGDPTARSALHPTVALALAEVDVAAGRAPTLPTPAQAPERIGQISTIALRHALASHDDPAVVRHFQRLVAVRPDTHLDLATVADVAGAMARTGRPDDAARVWRVGLDAAFRAEAAGLNEIGGSLGTLATVRLVREAALRYPDGRAVGDVSYLLPNQLWSVADELGDGGGGLFTSLDLRLTAAAWDREFLALHPHHPRAAASGLRLARSLLTLGAAEEAATWATLVRGAHPEDPLADALTYLEALARTEAGSEGVVPLLDRLIDQPFPQEGGGLGPSPHRSDAQLVMGRLFEARGDYARALDTYRAIASTVLEAAASVDALEAQRIEVPELIVLRPDDDAELEVTVQGVARLAVRAYAVDLRTVFLRDGGLQRVREMPVDGVSPVWSGQRRVDVGPFPETRRMTLPLAGTGAWLVHLEDGPVRATTLVVRSALQVATFDSDQGARRITVRRDGRPAPRIEVRAWTRSGVQALITDVRGVAEVPLGAPVLAFDGAHVAFSEPTAPDTSPARPAPRPVAPGLPLEQLDARLGAERARDLDAYDKRLSAGRNEGMSLEAL